MPHDNRDVVLADLAERLKAAIPGIRVHAFLGWPEERRPVSVGPISQSESILTASE